MAKLSPMQQERIKFHLAITDRVPPGDRVDALQRLNQDLTEMVIRLIKVNLDGLDTTYSLLTETTSVTRQEAIVGDVNRTITNLESSPKVVWERYLRQCDLMAQSLGIRNFRGKEDYWPLDMSTIDKIALPDGSSVGSRFLMSESLA